VVLLHEVIEAVNAELGLGLPHRAITGLAAALYQVRRDNAEVWRWLSHGK